ncbi:DUF3916 domain-containing protein [Niallia circulans]|uniref:DUF3916 domain-containing protein n=1 Tax=Niallia circulans TaxID=1397 RepID=A0A553SS76_NIACI|nr:DUF3916 domain-containing protein [Niallia circulans]TRZ39850.1 DUF3916 domain-containing protein [Niallia circulans]
MHRWKFDCGNKKKLRGLGRRCRNFTKYLNEDTQEIPNPEKDSYRNYWHSHLSLSKTYIDSHNTPNSVRRFCMQATIDRVAYLVSLKTEKEKDYRILTSICLPEYFDSTMIVFYDDETFNKFFIRESDYLRWIPLPPDRDIAKEWLLHIPEGLELKGYKEIIEEEEDDDFREGEIWFVGEIG